MTIFSIIKIRTRHLWNLNTHRFEEINVRYINEYVTSNKNLILDQLEEAQLTDPFGGDPGIFIQESVVT